MRVGDGANIRVMMDPWLPAQDSGFITTPLGPEYENVWVKDLMHPGSLQWDMDLIADIFQPRDQQLIFNIPLSSRVVDDQWYWT